MNHIYKVLLVCAVGILGFSPRARAGDASSPAAHRFGAGWDDGIGLRLRMSEGWSVGFNIAPTINQRTREYATNESDMVTPEDIRYTDKRNSLTISGMVFHDTWVSQWIGIGPYLLVKCRYEENVSKRPEAYIPARSTTITRDWSVELGLRPTFTYKGRFVLESRLGVGIVWTDRELWATNPVNYPVPSRHDQWHGRSGYTLGEDLGPGSILQFILYF